MYNRSLSLDSIGNNLKKLAGLIITENNLFKKSKENDSLIKNLPEIVTTTKGREYLGNQLYKRFLDALNDYNAGNINKAHYSGYLKEFNNFFAITDIKKLDIPRSLRADVIMKEITRFI